MTDATEAAARLRSACEGFDGGLAMAPVSDIRALLDERERMKAVEEHAIRVCNQDAQPEYPGRYSALRSMIGDLRRALAARAELRGEEG